MTVSSIVPVNNYTGNSSTKKFDFDFLIEEESELVVQHTNSNGITSILQYNVDYSIEEIGNKNGSYITFPLKNSSYNVLGNDEHISLMLSLQIQQESEFHNSSYFNLNILEWTFDYIVRILQILSRKVDRCVKVEESEEMSPDKIFEELNSKCEKVHSAYAQIVDLSEEIETNKDISVNSSNNAQKQANVAKEQANIATEQANIATQKTTEVVGNANQALSDIENKKTAAVNSVNNAGSTQITNIKTEGTKQVNLSKTQVTLATEQANIAAEQAKLAAINAKEASLIVGLSIALYCSENYVPDGCLPCDGGEYSKTQFTALWNNYLTGSSVRLNTCTYSEYDSEVETYGQCGKFAVDTTNQKFRVPLIKDGTVIQQALSDSELGKAYNAGLPNIEATLTQKNAWAAVGNRESLSGAFYSIDSSESGGYPGDGKTTSENFRQLGFDSSLSNSIYGNSDTVQPNAVALRYFVVVANGQANESMMDWSAWASSLQSKLNKDHSNDEKPYVTEVSDKSILPSWYRVWSDGWCEQGGSLFDNKSALTYSATFLKSYINNDYSIVTSFTSTATGSSIVRVGALASRTNTEFSMYIPSTASGLSWVANGYVS